MLMSGSRRADTSRACFIDAGLTLLAPFETVLQQSDTKLIRHLLQFFNIVSQTSNPLPAINNSRLYVTRTTSAVKQKTKPLVLTDQHNNLIQA